jgi:hypothetical protein
MKDCVARVRATGWSRRTASNYIWYNLRKYRRFEKEAGGIRRPLLIMHNCRRSADVDQVERSYQKTTAKTMGGSNHKGPVSYSCVPEPS